MAIGLLLAWLLAPASTDSFTRSFQVQSPSEVIALVRAGCARCAWGETGHEAVALRIAVDGRYSQHLVLVRGDALAEYRVTLGRLAAGSHRLTIDRDATLSAPRAGAATVDAVSLVTLPQDAAESTAQSMAPYLYARANTVGRFTDLPLVMWYEIVPTARGRQLRYSVIFSNEDGGTATDRLMATWGRTTDIEFVYGVEIDERGHVLAEQFQGPGHEVPAFKGRHEGSHPLLWVSTDNNMVSESGTTRIRYAPAPERADLRDASREIVMDGQPWTYAVTAGEMKREGKIVDDAEAGTGKIPDLRRYVHVEACTELENAAVVFSVRAVGPDGVAHWYDSDRGRPDFRIVRGGCFRGAVPLPESAGRPDAVRFKAFSRTVKDAPPRPSRVVLTRVNTVFTLDAGYLPRPGVFSWVGSVPLTPDGDWRELPF